MAWHPPTIVRLLVPLALVACGGSNRQPAEPAAIGAAEAKQPPAPPETEEDRERKRRLAANEVIPEGSSCLPTGLRNVNAPRLQLAAIGSEPVVCAVDQDRTRLLGSVACWGVEVRDSARLGALTYQAATPLPGRGFAVMFDDRCARGFCLPNDAKVPADLVALIAWNLDGTKVAVLAGDAVHIFDASSKAHESSFSIRGERGATSEPTGLAWNSDAIFVETSDGTTSPVWVFKADSAPVGAPQGAIEALGGKDRAALSTRNGSFVLLDRTRVAISELGLSALTIYEIESGKRTKLVRKIPATACKKEELDALWHDQSANVPGKCREFFARNYQHLIGADMVAGTKNLLALLRGPRLGELAVIDAKTLAEHKVIKMPWCDANAARAGATSAP
jgi:hypothetical protein